MDWLLPVHLHSNIGKPICQNPFVDRLNQSRTDILMNFEADIENKLDQRFKVNWTLH